MERIHVDYTRISEDKSGAGLGVDSQHEENGEFSVENGRVLAATYSDNDRSAYSGDARPDYLRLLADMEAGRIASVTIWHANRLHRSSDEVNAFIRLARARDVRLYSVSKGEAYNLEKASGRKQLRDDTSEAEYESEHRGERVALARKRQARRGDYGGGVRPFGWGVDTGRVRQVCVNPKAPAMERVYEDRPVLDMTRHNEAEAAEIRRWALELLAGVPVAQLMRDIAARGVPTVAEADGRELRRAGKAVNHGGWNSQTVRQILTHPRTSGHSVYLGEIVKRNAFAPILADDIRLSLITLFSDPARKTSPGNTPRWLGSLIYRCGRCDDGAVMNARRTSDGVFVYRCRTKGHCQWPAERTDLYVTEVLIALLASAEVSGLIPRPTGVDVAALRDELVVLDARKTDAAQRFALGRIDGPMLDTITATADARAAEIRAELTAGTAQSPLSEFAASDNARQTWETLSLGRKREILRYLLTVTLPPLGRGHGFSRDLIRIDRRRPAKAAA
jgi:DNA invertase Pin-like site-specific DNA recombinase